TIEDGSRSRGTGVLRALLDLRGYGARGTAVGQRVPGEGRQAAGRGGAAGGRGVRGPRRRRLRPPGGLRLPGGRPTGMRPTPAGSTGSTTSASQRTHPGREGRPARHVGGPLAASEQGGRRRQGCAGAARNGPIA